MRCIYSMVVVAALCGCATSSGVAPTRAVSGFDGGAVIDIAPHGAACSSMVCPALGAQWTSVRPGRVIITVLVYNQIAAITGASLSIDGKVTDLGTSLSATTFNRPGEPLKFSSTSFGVELSTVRAIAGAKRAWVRVNTPSGYVESAIVDGDTDSKALHAMRRFLYAVDSEPVKH